MRELPGLCTAIRRARRRWPAGVQFCTPVGLQTAGLGRVSACNSLRYLVGPPRFELGTSCTPSKRASQAAPRPDITHNGQPCLTQELAERRWPGNIYEFSTARRRRAAFANLRFETQP